jgi:hypothetical protein
VHTGEQTAWLHSVLRHGRHVLVVPEAARAGMVNDGALRHYRDDVDIVGRAVRGKTRMRNAGQALVLLVRPDGYVAARGTPDRMTQVTGYLCGVFGRAPASAISTSARSGPIALDLFRGPARDMPLHRGPATSDR